MDDTQASIKTAEAAAATRKRRSSILKSQKPQRTPFSELEFNVATPTDTAKSRRVSFSRRTGIAEFVTNEATTTWKNFYEEHNKSLESSGNESAANAPRPVIGHIGKRIFDQQFEEVEVVDIGGTLQTNTAVQEFQSSFNNVNLTQQLMAFELECVGDDKKLEAPAHFELSNLTEHQSKVFGDDLSLPVMNEMSNPISMNFSNIQPLGKYDDLEEIARDLERPHPNMMCGPFNAKDVSEYIEVDLNMTNVVMRSDDCDMSITDTIHSPKVQAVKQTSLHDTKLDEALVDKENIIMNPYVTPKESDNFAINEESNQVLVFDGKKLRVQSERQPIPEVISEEIVHPKVAIKPDVPKRKTIVLNVNDDLPNFIPDSSSLMVNNNTNNGEDLKKSVLYNDCDLSITQAVGGKVEKPKRKTIVFDDDMGNISITQVVSGKVIMNKEEKSKTVLYQNNTAEISITQAVSTNIIKTGTEKSVFYEDDLSFTKGLPGNLVLNKTSQDKTIYYQDGLDISVTKAIPDIIIKSKNILQREDNDSSNISMTQVIPSNIIMDEAKHVDINIYDDFRDKDIKQGSVGNSNNKNEKRKTIVYDDDAGNISLTQAIPTNILVENKVNIDKIEKITVNESLNILNFEKPLNKRKTIIYDDDQGEISITQAIPSNIIHMETKANDTLSNSENKDNRRKTILYDNEEGNISMTQVIPANIIQALDFKNKELTSDNADLMNVPENTNRRKTIIYDNENGDVSMTQAIPSNIIQPKSKIIEDSTNNRRKTVVYDDQDADVSMTQVIPSNIISTEPEIDPIGTNDTNENMASGRRKTIIYDNDEGDVSMTQLIPSNIMVANAEINKPEMSTNDNNMDISITRPLPTNIITNEKIENETNLTKLVQNNSLQNNVLNKSKIFDQSNCTMNMSSTKPVPAEKDVGNEIAEKSVVDPRKSLFDTDLKELYQQDILVYQSIEHNVSRPNTKTDISFKVKDDRISLNTSKLNNTSIKYRSKSNISSEKDDFEKDEQEDPHTEKNEENYEVENKTLTVQKSFRENNSLVVPKQNKKSILSDLLDMSNASLVVEPLDKKNINSPIKMAIEDVKPENETSNRLLFITRHGENEMNKENVPLEKISNSDEIVEVTQKDTHYSDEEEHELLNESTEPIVSEEIPKSNRHFEQMLSPDLKQDKILDKSDQKPNRSVVRDIKSIRNADDTKDLLEMLSHFTDGPTEEHDEKSIAVNATSRLSSDEPRRLSFLPKRQSIALSREVLLNNISMAQAALQMSRSYNDSDHIEDTHDSPEETEKSPNKSDSMSSEVVKNLHKSVRMSTEVVKTLNFEDDESISETSMRPDMKATPLKKTTFGETTYITDDKAKVIPTYLKDVSDGIKALMHDLVKPTADMPFEEDSFMKKAPSSCSTQIQANIVTSSQIDIASELYSNPESNENVMQTESLATEVAALGKRAITQALRQSIKPMDISMEVDQKPVSEINKSPVSILKQSPTARPSPVIVFDQLNPLNNILLTQTDCTKVHGYDPIKSNDSKDDKVQNDKIKKHQIEIERVSTHYKIEKQMGQQDLEVNVGDVMEKMNESGSKESNISKPLSIDRSTEGIVTEHKHTEINTVITMKDNKEILEAYSSLTLVDEGVHRGQLDTDMEDSEDSARQKSPVKIIYKVEDMQKDSDVTSNDESEIYSNRRKRSYSPTKQDKQLSKPVDVTPKPVSKMQKMSLSPKVPEANGVTESPDKKQRSPDKKKSPKKRNSVKQDLTVQQVIVDCYKDASADRNTDRKCQESLKIDTHEYLASESVSNTESMKSETTFTSSKKAMCKILSQNSEFDQKSDEEDSKSLMDFKSAVKVVRMIEMLPFMGRECEWETRARDVWSFLLLRSRLRLVVRVSRPPLADLEVSAVREEEREPSSSLCVRFAEEAMRYECAQCSCVDACPGLGVGTCPGLGVGMCPGLGVGMDAVPGLLRRCVETARLALLWARVMRDAKLRLAYHLTKDGDLTFKVANTCVRAVWEVRLRIQLEVSDAEHSAYPRAGCVRVLPVLPTPTPTPKHVPTPTPTPKHVSNPTPTPKHVPTPTPTPTVEDVRRLVDNVKHDWGHVPTTIWRLFRYLKNKTREDDLGVWGFKN